MKFAHSRARGLAPGLIDRASRSALLTFTALAGVAALPQTAQASEAECRALPVEFQVACLEEAAARAALPAPSATPDTPQSAGGVVVQTLNTPVNLTITTNVTATDFDEDGVTAQSQTGPVAVTVNSGVRVEARGAEADGILAQSGSGPVSLTINGQVLASNANGGDAVSMGSFTGPLSLMAGANSVIRASGRTADAVAARSGSSISIISQGSIIADGPLSVAILADAGGQLVIDTNRVTGNGFGIVASSTGAAPITIISRGAMEVAGRGIQAANDAAGARDMNITINGPLTVRPIAGVEGFGVLGLLNSLQAAGNLTLTSTGPVTVTGAAGARVNGLFVQNFGAGLTTVNLGGDLTVLSSSGNTATGVSAVATFAPIVINHLASSALAVAGGGAANAREITGILAASVSGPINITSAGNISVTTSGNLQSAAIIAQTLSGQVNINQTGNLVIRGANTFGIAVQYGTLPPFAQPFASQIPQLPPTANPNTAITARNVQALDGVAIGVQGGTAAVTVAAGGTVTGGLAGIVFLGTFAVSVTNNGTLSALGSVAVDASSSSGGLTLTNANGGVILGGVRGSAFADSFTNAAGGTLILAGLASDAGAGADTFANDGTVALAGGAGPVTGTFNGLETVTNGISGLIDLRGRGVGDVLTFGGSAAFVGGGGQLALDVNLAGPGANADRLVIGGAASGTTRLVINDLIAGPGAFNPGGILLVTAASAGANAFSLASGPVIDKGLWDYALRSTANGSQWRLVSGPGREVMELGTLVTSLQSIWDRTGVNLSERASQQGLGPDAPEGTSAWIQVSGGGGERQAAGSYTDTFAVASTFDTSHDLTTSSATFGLEHSFATGSGGVSIGGGIGPVSAEQAFTASPDRTRISGWTGVGYGLWRQGGFHAGLSVHRNELTLRIGQPGLGLETRADAVSTGVALDAGWRFATGASWYAEPAVRLSRASTSVDSIAILGTPIGFADGTSQRANLSVRVGRAIAGGEGRFRQDLWLRAGAAGEFGDDNAVAFASGPGFATLDGTDDRWGTLSVGWDAISLVRGVTIQMRVDYTGGGDVAPEGATASFAARVPF